MTYFRGLGPKLTRRAALVGAALALMAGTSPAARAQELSGELVILQWQGGTDGELWQDLEADFIAKNPGVTVRELVVTGQGDMRGPMRIALLGGEKVDIIINNYSNYRAGLNVLEGYIRHILYKYPYPKG